MEILCSLCRNPIRAEVRGEFGSAVVPLVGEGKAMLGVGLMRLGKPCLAACAECLERLVREAEAPAVEHARLLLPLSELDLTVRAMNALDGHAETIGDLCRHSEHDLLQLRNFGRVVLKEVQTKLMVRGLRLGMSIPKAAP